MAVISPGADARHLKRPSAARLGPQYQPEDGDDSHWHLKAHVTGGDSTNTQKEPETWINTWIYPVLMLL